MNASLMEIEVESTASIPEWQSNRGSLKSAFELSSTANALQFIVRLGVYAERLNLHPVVHWRYRLVEVEIRVQNISGASTHTEELAQAISKIAADFQATVMPPSTDREFSMA